MSNNYWEDEDDDLDTDTDVQMDGSDLLKKLRKAKRADEKIRRIAEEEKNRFAQTSGKLASRNRAQGAI